MNSFTLPINFIDLVIYLYKRNGQDMHFLLNCTNKYCAYYILFTELSLQELKINSVQFDPTTFLKNLCR